MTNDFHRLSDASWYGTAYFLSATALLPTWGNLFQTLNLKLVYVLNTVTFMVGSLLCGVSPSSVTFIIGRAITGLAAGGMFSGCMTVLAYSVPLHRRASFTGAFGALYGVLLSL
jgi:MFS family permease